MRYNKNGLFSIRPIISPTILIACAIAGYYYIDTHYLFIDHLFTIYVVMKLFVALLIIIGSARSLLMPFLTFLVGITLLVLIQSHGITLISSVSAWQLIVVAAVGFVISLATIF